MSLPQALMQNSSSEPDLQLLVELPGRSRVFLSNVRALLLPRGMASLELQSAPAPFWPDVFVRRRFPWSGLLQSVAYHGTAFALLVAFTRLFSLQPRVVETPKFDHSQVVYYQASDYLPPLDTRQQSLSPPAKANPEFSPQPIISVPPEADNRSQTIVTPPKVRLKRDVAMPNVVAWSDSEKPRLAIPDAPLTPAAEITRMAPQLENPVVTPPPDAAQLAERRKSMALQDSVVAPPPELQASNANSSFHGLQPELIAPPPNVSVASGRLGDMNIAPSAVIAPAPQLPVAAQRSLPGGRLGPGTITGQVVPPPPSVAGGAASGASFGSRGRMIALNLHPAVGAPADPPAGNRRGTFTASPEGHSGASGTPASSASAAGAGKGNGSSTRTSGSELPSGLYVGKTAEKTSAVAGTPSGNTPAASVNPNLLAEARPPRVSAPAHPADSAAKLTEPERAVFYGRRFYSLTLNMPNLNSAGGSWVVHFAEAKQEPGPGEGSAADISQPMATRKVDPAYPMQLMRQNVAGTVILYAVIHADGSVGDVKVLRGVDDRLDRFASEAVSQWKFDPAMKNGVPVDVEATFQIPFHPSRIGTGF